ncbi:MAG: bifunctional DNA primase/polymerase [Gemmatimonadota bacterium]
MSERAMLEAALEYADRGWAIIPIDCESKKPLVEWGAYADERRPPDEDEITEWWTRWPYAYIAVLTGPVSGLVIVDTDSDEARAAADRVGLTRTPVAVQTRKGRHFYWAFPDTDKWIKNRVGGVGDGSEWPRVEGLDLRGSKGYALLPPSRGYEWRLAPGADLDELPEYPGPDMDAWEPPASNVYRFEDFRFGGLDLSGVRVRRSVWQDTAGLVAEIGKLPPGGGNQRDERVWRCLSEGAARGLRGDDLVREAYQFQEQYFTEPLGGSKTEAMAARVEAMETRNHPERAAQPPAAPPVPAGLRTLTTADIAELERQVGAMRWHAEPILPVGGTIVQVHGYSGHGKSTVVRHLAYAAAAGADRFGPFEVGQAPRVLYFDFENGRRNLSRFLSRARRSFGDAGDRFQVWAPFVSGEMLNLRSEAGIEAAGAYITACQPNVVVIDTVRSAWAGLEENSAEAWTPVNQIAMQLRNAGMCVILVHHSNKPGDNGVSGREAGSSNQLTVLESQLKVTQVYREQATARMKGGLYDGDLTGTPMTRMASAPVLRDGEQLEVCVEVRWGKVREWSEVHEPAYYLGFLANLRDDTLRVVSPPTRKQQAVHLSRPHRDWQGHVQPPLTEIEIATRLGVPAAVVRDWIGGSQEAQEARL